MVSRRKLIKVGAGGLVVAPLLAIPVLRAAGADIFSSGDKGATPAPPGPVTTIIQSPGPGLPAPGYVAGAAVLRDGDLLYVRTGDGDRVVRLANAAIWKGEAAPASAIEMGDDIIASGTVLADGTIDAHTVDVNIVQVRGVVTAIVGPGAWTARDNHGREFRLRIDPEKPPVELLVGGSPVTVGDFKEPVPGQSLVAIGLRLADGSIRVTRLYL